MNYKEKKLKEFEEFSKNTEIQYDYPLYQHYIYDDIKLFISKTLEEQGEEHKKDLESLRIELNTLYKKSLDEALKK